MLNKHRRLPTIIHILEDGLDSPNPEVLTISSDTSSEKPVFLRGLAPGSVYIQAYKLCPKENYSTDFESFSDSSVEILISELEAVDDSFIRIEQIDLETVMDEIIFHQMQKNLLHELEKQKIKKNLLLRIKSDWQY